MFHKNRIETIPFREFMSGSHHAQKETFPNKSIRFMSAFFPTITPQNLFPIHDPSFALFFTGVGLIASAAFFERFTARSGMFEVSETIEVIGRFLLKRSDITELQAPFLDEKHAEKILKRYKSTEWKNRFAGDSNPSIPSNEPIIFNVLEEER